MANLRRVGTVLSPLVYGSVRARARRWFRDRSHPRAAPDGGLPGSVPGILPETVYPSLFLACQVNKALTNHRTGVVRPEIRGPQQITYARYFITNAMFFLVSSTHASGLAWGVSNANQPSNPLALMIGRAFLQSIDIARPALRCCGCGS